MTQYWIIGGAWSGAAAAGPEGAPGSREPEMVGPFASYDDVMLAWIERAPLLLAGPCRRYRILAEGSAGLPARPLQA